MSVSITSIYLEQPDTLEFLVIQQHYGTFHHCSNFSNQLVAFGPKFAYLEKYDDTILAL